MSMMIHRNRKRKEEKKSALVQSAEIPESYVNETPEEQQYTRTDINRMSKGDLASLAAEVGIEGSEDMSGSDLKKELIERFGLQKGD